MQESVTEATKTGACVNVGLVQINNSFSGQSYLPLSVATLESYARANLSNPNRFEFALPIHSRIPIHEAVDSLVDCDLVGFSVYVWNFEISLEIARRLKKARPNTLIVFGGPHVPDLGEGLLQENPFIDIAVHGEGERTFTEILEHFDDRDWIEVAGLSFRGENGSIRRSPPRTRFRNLSEVPSPYLDGTFARLVDAFPEMTWIGLWETNRGCPFKCTFCDWGSATGDKVAVFEEERLYEEVDWFARHNIEFIFCCDANFGIKKRDVDIVTYVADVKKRTGYPVALSVQNTKNATERAYLTQKILSDAGLNKGVALSMQSLDEDTLRHIKRDNISLDTYFELQKRFTKDKVETYSDLILGMPGETHETFFHGITMLIESGQHNRIQFNNLSILPNAEMGDPAYQQRHGMRTVRSKIINIHGERVDLEDDVPEYQDLVVATESMPDAEWRRTRVLCWIVALYHFDKLFQIPLIAANKLGGIDYKLMFEAFLNADPKRYPVTASVNRFFYEEAQTIQNGGNEYHFSPDWLGIYWPQDELVFIKLTAEGKLQDFIDEALLILEEVVARDGAQLPKGILVEAARLNATLIKQPNVDGDIEIQTHYDIMGFYNAVRTGEPDHLREASTTVRIERSKSAYKDFQKWCREVVWWGNKKGAYLYSNSSHEKQLAGHF